MGDGVPGSWNSKCKNLKVGRLVVFSLNAKRAFGARAEWAAGKVMELMTDRGVACCWEAIARASAFTWSTMGSHRKSII